jgi:CheY-like chemotaxis protein/HPt (histidine-containing phosphotransfer) domain-containing protein
LRILLAEDLPANQRLMVRLLQRLGHQVWVAEHGQEAIDLVRRLTFDLIFMDVQMPKIDGFRATAAIRRLQESQHRRIPIVAVTAHTMPGDRRRCLAAGMDAHLSKPINFQQLTALVETMSRRAKSSPPPPPGQPGRSPQPREEGSPETPLFDYRAAVARLDNDDGLFDEMIRFFCDDSPGLLRQLRIAIVAGDPRALQRAAHSLRGLAATFDATAAVAAGRHVEELGAAGNLAEAESALAALEFEVRRLCLALTDFLPQKRS